MFNVPITLTHSPKTLLEQARWLYHERADQTALVMLAPEGETTFTYSDFFTRAAQYAHALESVGVQPGDLVALILQHGEDVLFSFWGAMLLGAVPSIFPFLTEKLDRDKYFDGVRQLVNHEDIPVVITYGELEPDLRPHLQGIDTLKAIIDKNALEPGGDIDRYLAMNPAAASDTAFLQHSSGSTGLQKGVMLSHEAVLNQVASYSDAIHLSADDVIVSWLPLYHDMGLIAGFIMPVLQGIKLVLMSPLHWIRDPKILLWAVHHHRGTLCWLPNFAYNFLATRVRDADLEGLNLASWRTVVNCSEPVYAESHRLFIERYGAHGLNAAALTTCYAMAENTFAVTQGGIDGPLNIDVVDRQRIMDAREAVPTDGDNATVQEFVSCGTPIANCEIKIVDETNRSLTLPERRVGEIALRSNSMLSGYYKNPDATAEALEDGWYFTGDMGYIAEGELYITGRKKDLIIVGGKNIYPQDIENLLNDVPGLYPGRATAFGIFNDKLGTEDLAIVAEVSNGIDPTDRDATAPILREIRSRVGQSTDVAARYVLLVESKWLLKTSSGKIARRANRQKFIDEVLGNFT
jgi:acyl-CoA synthetase (AMP-forming)/AMP-acid ligase II